MLNDTDTSYMHVSRCPSPRPVRAARRKPTPATAIVDQSRRVVAEIAEYRGLCAAADPGAPLESFDLGRLCALEARLLDGGKAHRFPCSLVTWLRVDGGAACPRIAVVRCISTTRVTLTAHPGLDPGHRVRLTFRMGTSAAGSRVTLCARVVWVDDEHVELELEDDPAADPMMRAA